MIRICTLLCFLQIAANTRAGVIVLEGNYTGENIWIQNPFTGNGTGFCVQKVSVNGKEVPFEQSSAFQIDLRSMGLAKGEKISIRIEHKDNCKPKVIPPVHGGTPRNFDVLWIKFIGDSLLSWQAKKKGGKNSYIIEQYRWNKWIKIQEVDWKSGHGTATYSVNVKKYLHSGENQMRLKSLSFSTHYGYSKPIKLILPDKTKALDRPIRCGAFIDFHMLPLYQVYDEEGNIVMSGMDTLVRTNDLPKGVYYLNYDNKTVEFIKK